MILNKILELYPDEKFLKVDGFDDAVIGVDYDMKLVYSTSKIISILMEDMTEEEALEYFYYNIGGAYMGEKTPIYINYNNDFYTVKELRKDKLKSLE